MPTHTFRYAHQRTLDKLALAVGEERCSLDVTMHPVLHQHDDPFFLAKLVYARHKTQPISESNSIQHVMQDILQFGEDRQLLFRSFCAKESILLFRELLYSGSVYYPRIELVRDFLGNESDYPEAWAETLDPVQFAERNRWFSIRFQEITSPQIGNAKRIITHHVAHDYVVSSLHAELNPYDRESEYVSSHFYDISLRASEGTIIIEGDTVPNSLALVIDGSTTRL